jgi:hypothetical protein
MGSSPSLKKAETLLIIMKIELIDNDFSINIKGFGNNKSIL